MVYNQATAQEEEITPSPQQSADIPAAVYDHELVHHMTASDFSKIDRLVKDKPVPEGCCKNILKIGREFHEGLMNLVISTYELKDIGYKILPRSKQIWNQYVETAAALIGAPLAFED